MSKRLPSAEDIRTEHLDAVDQLLHWGYLVLVLGGGTALMLGLIALLGAG